MVVNDDKSVVVGTLEGGATWWVVAGLAGGIIRGQGSAFMEVLVGLRLQITKPSCEGV